MRRVVVTGMGVISPVGQTVETFWENVKAGRHGITPISFFDTTDFKAKLAAEVKDFNPRQYMEKADILRSDRYAQLGMCAAVQAVEQSGIIGAVEPERIGVYFGTGIGGIHTMMTEYEKLKTRGPRRVSAYFVPMLIANMCAGSIAIRYGCKGAAMPAVTACASGSNAIGEAVRAIRHGYADAMITGGAEAAVNELSVAGFINMQALTVSEDPDAASLPFDKRRGGFVIGEGGAALVLEEYEHARARGAVIYGEICGYGSTCDAYHITSPAEDGSGAARAMTEAMKDAGVTPEMVDYINAHGTSTHHNDLFETRAIHLAMGDAAEKVKISSTKSMVGHLLGAAGGVEFIACVKSIEDQCLHGTAGYREKDEACDLNYLVNGCEKADVDVVLSNSLGFGGHNATLCVRKYKE